MSSGRLGIGGARGAEALDRETNKQVSHSFRQKRALTHSEPCIARVQITRFRALADGYLDGSPAARNGGSARVLPGRACHTVLRCLAGINRGRGYRPGTGWTSLGSP